MVGESCNDGAGEKSRQYNALQQACMVADLHRNLIKGGIFLNPASTKYKKGKLRLIYECMPWAFIYEIAGGRATDGKQRILDIPFSDLHQRTPLFIGSSSMIDDLEKYLDTNDAN